MKTATFLLPLLLLVCSAHALPRFSEVTSSLQEEHPPPAAAPLPEEVELTDDSDLTRARRSPQQQQQPESRGSVTGGVTRERGVGTVVHAQGQGNVWRSGDGRTSVDAQGEWSRVVRGPARGRPNYNVGVNFSHRW